MTLPSKRKWQEMSGYERRRLYKQLSWREKDQVAMWQVTDDINERIAERNYDRKCELREEKRLRIKQHQEERREIQKLLIEEIAKRKHSPNQIAEISGYSRTYILALSREHFTPEEHREFVKMDEGVAPRGPCTALQIDPRTEDEKWLADWEDKVERRQAAARELFVKTEIDKKLTP